MVGYQFKMQAEEKGSWSYEGDPETTVASLT